MPAGENQDEADPCGDNWGLSLHTGEDGRLLTLLTARTPSESQSHFFFCHLWPTRRKMFNFLFYVKQNSRQDL